MNWRKPLLLAGLRLSGSPAPAELELIHAIERAPAEIRRVQRERLTRLLRHSWDQSPYYRDLLETCGAVRDGKVDLDRFPEVPFLTKDILREQGERLRARRLPGTRKAFPNASGGSTGQPAKFWQDDLYWGGTIANRIYHFELAGKQLGEREVKLWGSERDLIEGTIGWRAKLENWAYNRKFVQCYLLPEDRIREILRAIDRWRPALMWCYGDGIEVIARHVIQHRLTPHAPTAIVVGGSTLYPHTAELVERAFRAPVINAYGSREMGAVACQCRAREGLHISAHSHVVETIGTDGRPVAEQDGELVLTSLTNYALPFLRYRIGDQGRLTSRACSCGSAFPLLESVSGRTVETLVNARGDLINPMYFIYLIRAGLGDGLVRQFQVVQEAYDRIVLRMVLEPGAKPSDLEAALAEAREKIRRVMGEACAVEPDYVDQIPRSPSGKYLYVIRRIAAPSGGPPAAAPSPQS